MELQLNTTQFLIMQLFKYNITSIEIRAMHEIFSINVYRYMILKNKVRHIMQ